MLAMNVASHIDVVPRSCASIAWPSPRLRRSARPAHMVGCAGQCRDRARAAGRRRSRPSSRASAASPRCGHRGPRHAGRPRPAAQQRAGPAQPRARGAGSPRRSPTPRAASARGTSSTPARSICRRPTARAASQHYLYCDHTWALAQAPSRPCQAVQRTGAGGVRAGRARVARAGLPTSSRSAAYVRDNLIAHYGLPPDRVTAVGSGMGAIEPYHGPKDLRQAGAALRRQASVPGQGRRVAARGLRARARASARSDADHRRRRAQPRLRAATRPGITFHAHLPWDELQQLYRDATLLVQPMLNDPWGQVYLEAMVSRTPVMGLDAQRPAGTGRWRPPWLPGRPRRSRSARRGDPERAVRSAAARAHGSDRASVTSSRPIRGIAWPSGSLYLLKRRVNREVGSMSRKVAL